MKEELEWVRKNPKGRQAKSKARIKAFEELSSQEYQKRSETKELYIPPGPRLGDVVIEVNNLAKKFGDRTLYQGVSFSVPRGAIVGIIGANGMGKTTLRSEEHTSELQSLMRISYAVFCLKKKKHSKHKQTDNPSTQQRIPKIHQRI